MKQAATLKVKEHFDAVNQLWQSRQAKEWQARLASEAVAMNVMGLSYDQDGQPPKNMYIVTTKVLEYVLAQNSEGVIGDKVTDEAWDKWLADCRKVISTEIENNKTSVAFAFAADAKKPDTALILDKIKAARRYIKESENPVENPALTALVTTYQLSDAYKNCFENIRAQYLESLKSSQTLAVAIQEWPEKTYKEQKEWLQDQVNLLAEIQGRESGLNIAGTYVYWYTGLNTMGRLVVDLDEPTSCNDEIRLSGEENHHFHEKLSCALDAAIHEQYHQFHNALARAVRFNLIDETHPLYEDALYFDSLWKRDGYIDFGAAYKNQPDERYTISFSDSVGTYVSGQHEKMKRNGALRSDLGMSGDSQSAQLYQIALPASLQPVAAL